MKEKGEQRKAKRKEKKTINYKRHILNLNIMLYLCKILIKMNQKYVTLTNPKSLQSYFTELNYPFLYVNFHLNKLEISLKSICQITFSNK